MAVPAEKRRYTIAEYLDLEEKAEVRHEFHEGEILAMSGGTYKHSIINLNTGALLVQLLKGKACRPLESNMRVRIPPLLKYLYPDLSIVCGGPKFDPDDPNQTTILNPTVVIEILSESTERYDRSQKFDFYRQNEFMQEYVLISQNSPMIETYLRQQDGSWLFNTYKGLSASAALKSVQLSLRLNEVYADVEFEPPPPLFSSDV